jgi:hypothetical protein
MSDTIGQADIRGENISRAVKGFALQQYKLKQVLLQTSSNKWTETFYKETATELSGGTGSEIKGVPRLAQFPYVEPSWTKVQGRHLKHAAEGVVSIEDKMTDAIDVQARTILRVARAVAKSVDDHIYYELNNAAGIGTAAASNPWDDATAANQKPIDDILAGIQNMQENNYDPLQNGYLLLTPKDYRSLLQNSKVINNPSFKTADVVSNGRVGQILGLTIIVTNSVDDDEAMIIIGQRAATWKSAVPLTSAVIEDKGIKFTIRSWEIGQIQVTDPLAIYVITNTQA